MKESFHGLGDICFDIAAPRYIHDSGSAVKQMSGEIYCDYVDTYGDNSHNVILYMVLHERDFLVMDPHMGRFRIV